MGHHTDPRGNCGHGTHKKKLSQCLPDVDINTQIICLSTTKALAAQKYGVMNSEFASLTDRIGCLVSKSIETRLYIGKMYMKDE